MLKFTFLRKMRLKLPRTMYLDTKRETENAITLATMGVFTFSKNWDNLLDLLYQKIQ